MTQTAITKQPLPTTQWVYPLGTPGLRLGESLGYRQTICWQPCIGTPKKLRHHCELESIDAVRCQQICGELSATQKHEPLNPSRAQRLEPLRPGWRQREPTIKALMHGCRSQEPTLKWLGKERPVAREAERSADHHSGRLLWSPLLQALLQ